MVVGLAAESENHIKNGRKKLTKKSCDLIVVNDISALGSNENEVWVVGKNLEQKIAKSSKQKIAQQLVKIIGEYYGERKR
jgi:phosphopantothenoylcysteine decarboxylase/phosphopantothenate--cysteine ligase